MSKKKIIELRQQGFTIREVAKKLKVSTDSVCKYSKYQSLFNDSPVVKINKHSENIISDTQKIVTDVTIICDICYLQDILLHYLEIGVSVHLA